MLAELAEEEGENSGTPSKFVPMETEEINTELEEKRERRRKRIITELFETEKTYIKHMELAHKASLVRFLYLFFKKQILNTLKTASTYRPWSVTTGEKGCQNKIVRL